MSDFEGQYLDVLQNIEFAIVSVYRRQAGLLDYEVDKALDVLVREYQAERQGRPISQPQLSGLSKQVYEGVKGMCEWRLGRTALEMEGEKTGGLELTPLTLDEAVACLKRIRKSVQKWNKRSGRQGYLQFIDGFIV